MCAPPAHVPTLVKHKKAGVHVLVCVCRGGACMLLLSVYIRRKTRDTTGGYGTCRNIAGESLGAHQENLSAFLATHTYKAQIAQLETSPKHSWHTARACYSQHIHA